MRIARSKLLYDYSVTFAQGSVTSLSLLASWIFAREVAGSKLVREGLRSNGFGRQCAESSEGTAPGQAWERSKQQLREISDGSRTTPTAAVRRRRYS